MHPIEKIIQSYDRINNRGQELARLAQDCLIYHDFISGYIAATFVDGVLKFYSCNGTLGKFDITDEILDYQNEKECRKILDAFNELRCECQEIKELYLTKYRGALFFKSKDKVSHIYIVGCLNEKIKIGRGAIKESVYIDNITYSLDYCDINDVLNGAVLGATKYPFKQNKL